MKLEIAQKRIIIYVEYYLQALLKMRLIIIQMILHKKLKQTFFNVLIRLNLAL